MAEITDLEGVKAWLEGQEHLPRICCAARAALRGLPGVINVKGAVRSDFAIVIMRALLVPIVAGKFPRENLETQANSASYQASPFSTPEFGDSGICIVHSARALTSAVFSSQYPAAAAAECTKLAADAVAISGHRSPGNSAARSGRSSSYSAFFADANRLEVTQSPLEVFDIGLWPEQEMPEGLAENLQSLRRFWQSDPKVWGYWEKWYLGFLNGTPPNWDVQLEIAKLDKEDWEKGPEWIAEKIDKIETELSAKLRDLERRYPEHEPTSVDHVLRNPTAFAAQSALVADQVKATIDTFQNEFRLNEMPYPFHALGAVSHSFQNVSTILLTPSKKETERILREEIGRLNARIAELETDLEKASRASEPIFSNEFKAAAGRSLGDWKLYAGIVGAVSALAGTLWVVSGDNIGPERRLEMLRSYQDAFFGSQEVDEDVALKPPKAPQVEI